MSTYGGGNQYQSFFNNPSGSGSTSNPFGGQGGPMNPNDFMDLFNNPNSMSPEDRARGMGYLPQADGSFYNPGSWVTGETGQIRSADSFADPAQGMNQMGQAAFYDLMRMDKFTDQNFAEGRANIDDVRQSVLGGAEAIRDTGQDAFDYMQGLAGDARAEGQQMFDDRVSAIQGKIDEFDKKVSETLPAQISAGTARRQTNGQTRQNLEAEAKTNNPEAKAALMAFEQQETAFHAEQATNIAMGAANSVIQAELQGEGLIGQAAGLKSSYDARADQLGQTGMQFQQVAVADAAKFEAQGLTGVANMVLANPYNPVGLLPTIMAMFQFSQTPGASEFDIPQDFFSDYMPQMGGTMMT